MAIIWMILIVLIAAYLIAIMPHMVRRPDVTPLMGHYYAHRGLHDNKTEAPENSMAAFRKAVDAGYGIELDVQLTKDRIPVVFHVESLQRVCGIKGNVRDYTYEELLQFHLCDSEEKIPLFADFLKLVDGKVPLIIEIKIHEDHNIVCEIADSLIREYKGVYCIESFHPLAVKWYKEHRPEVIRGQLSSRLAPAGERESFLYMMSHYLLFNCVTKPDFIAYDHLHKSNLSRTLCQRLYHTLSVAWTIKSQEQLDASRKQFDLFIFEGFIPRG